MRIDIAPILKLSRSERLMIIQAIAESLQIEEEAMPKKIQEQRLEAISARIHAGERGKSWEEVRKKIMNENGI